MGTKTYVNVSTQRLLDDGNFKYAYELAMQMHVYKQRKVMRPDLKGSGLAEELVNTYSAASHKKFKRLRNYAAAGKYEYGLPTSNFSTEDPVDMMTVVVNYLENQNIGKEVLVRSYLFGELNVLTAAWNKLITSKQYNGITNELVSYSNAVGKPCYLVDGQIVLSQASLEMLATKEVKTQVGISLDSGSFLERPQNFTGVQPDILLGETDKLVFRYGYEQPITDITPPSAPIINNITLDYIDGYTEFDSLLDVYINDVQLGGMDVAADGYFSYQFYPTTISSTDNIKLITRDATGNSSTPVTGSYPYTNTSMAIQGTKPQGQTEIVYVTDETGLGTFNPDYGDIDTVPTGDRYVQVFYTLANELKLFNYVFLSGGVPEIDAVQVDIASSLIGKYYPSIYIRLDAVDIIKYDSANLRRKASERAMKMVGLDLREMTDQIKESITDLNDEYRDIYLSLGIHPKDSINDSTTSKYLYDYFDTLFPMCTGNHLHAVREQRGNNQEGYYYVTVFLPDGRKTGIAHTVKDNIKNHLVSFESIDKKILTPSTILTTTYGHLQIGEVKGTFTTQPDTTHVRTVYINDDGYNDELYTRGSNYYLTYVKRTGENEYTSISIQRLVTQTYMHGKVINLDSSDSNLTIPIDYAVINEMEFKDSEIIFNRSLNITVSHLKTVKEKWYETGFFKIVMAVVSIAMNVIIPGSGITLQAIMAAAVTTILIGFVVNIAIGILIKLAISLGISVEFIATLAAIIALAAAAFGNGKFDFSKISNAKELMKALNTTLDSYQRSIQETIINLQKEMDLFSKYMEDKTKKLKETQEMLNTGFIKPDLELLTAPISNTGNIYLGEAPEDFYTRTTNISVTEITLDIVNTFLEVTTQLPKKIVTLNHNRSDSSIDDVLLIN